MPILNRPEIQRKIDHAKTHHTSRYEDEEVVCDCVRCYGQNISWTYATVRKHRLRYGKSDAERENYPPPPLFSPAGIRSTRGSPHARRSRTPTPKPYSYNASPHFPLRASASRSPLSQLSNSPRNSLRSFQSRSSAPPSSPANPKPIPVLSPTLSSPTTDLRRLLGLLAHFYPRHKLLRTPRSITPCSPGLEPLPDNNDTPWYAPHVIWEMMGSPRLPTGPRSPSLASIDSARAPSQKDEDEEDYWKNLLDEDDLPRLPPRLFEDGERAPEARGEFDGFLGDFFNDENGGPPCDDPPDQPDDGPNQEDDPPVFQGFFRDLDAQPDAEDPPPNDHPCAAFDDEPAEFRNIMIRTYLLSAFSGVTNESIAEILMTHKTSFQMLEAHGQLPEELRLRLPFFPETLRTLQHRLGVDLERFIKIYAICPGCGTSYDMEFINLAPNPACPHPIAGEECGEPLYKEKRLYGHTRKRIPFKSYPYIPLLSSLERHLVRPGFPEILQMWRGPGDEPGDAPPVSRQDWMDTMDPDVPLSHPWNAWAWRNQPIGLDRQYDEETGQYGDVPTAELRSLVRLAFGLGLSINIDGFLVFKKGKYSVQGVYLVINNLPLELRTRHENMILAMVMSGPQEPSAYEYDQMLKPLIDDLVALGKGVYLWVHRMDLNRCEKMLVHAAINNQLVDYMSRMKTNGHVGTRSDLNFCLYCKSKRCYLSHKYDWLIAPVEEKEPMRKLHGTRFVEIDRLPGFFGPTQSPIDPMHMFDLNMSPWIFKDTLLDVGMFNAWDRRQTEEESPKGRLNAALQELYLPSSCARIITSLDKITSRVKAEQWKNITAVLHILLFIAWNIDDTIPDRDVPRGNSNTVEFKQQQRVAGLLHDQRMLVHFDQGGDDHDKPTLRACAASRNARLYYRNILRYVVAINILTSRDITPNELDFAQRLLERLAISFTQMNIHLSPTFHYAMHIQPFVLKYGAMPNASCYPFERANLQLQTTNNNSHGLGVLETTMARGFLKRTGCFHILHRMEDIPEPTLSDTRTIDTLCKAMQYGPEYERHRGALAAVLAGEAYFHGRERIRLAQMVPVNLSKNRQHYALLVDFCNRQLPGHVIYGYGNRPLGGVYLDPKESTETTSHLLHCGIRFGEAGHYRGNNSRFGYIRGDIPVIIRKIYRIKLVTLDEIEHTVVCALVQRFRRTEHEVAFPWALWAERLRTDYWRYEEFENLEAVSVDNLTGVFALAKVSMSHGDYWVTRGLQQVLREDLD